MLDALNLEQDFRSQGNTVLEKLAEWVEHKGDTPCIYYGEDDRWFTFREFNQLCNRAAKGFARLGVKKGDRVSVLSKNAFWTVVAMFSAWKLGALYSPINNNYRGDLLVYILKDVGPTVLFLDQRFVGELNAVAHRLGEFAPQLVVYEPKLGDHDYDAAVNCRVRESFKSITMDALLDTSNADPGVTITEKDLATIIYTSGTTGNPMGVVHNHKWMHGYIFLHLKFLHEGDVIYNDLPLYHVGGACFNVVRAIWAGCKLALWDRFSPRDFWRRIRSSDATHAMLMDVMIDWLMRAPYSAENRNNTLKVVGMIPLPENHHAIAKRFGFDFVMCGYGSSELGAGFCGLIDELGENALGIPCEEITRAEIQKILVHGDVQLKRGFMGVPSPLIEVNVVNESGKVVGPGVRGRPAFRHKLPDMLFSEYLNKPQATSEVVRDGWFYPLDRISYDDDGFYYFEDREQGFIRVRGENLSAVAVEHQLQRHPAIQRSAVVGVPAVEGNEQDIAAFLLLNGSEKLTEDMLRAWTEVELPKFMQPRYFRFLEELPVTPTFKVEKYKLKAKLMEDLDILTNCSTSTNHIEEHE